MTTEPQKTEKITPTPGEALADLMKPLKPEDIKGFTVAIYLSDGTVATGIHCNSVRLAANVIMHMIDDNEDLAMAVADQLMTMVQKKSIKKQKKIIT